MTPNDPTGAPATRTGGAGGADGAVLPVVLFLMLGLVLLSTSMLLLAGTERVVSREALAYLRASVREQAALRPAEALPAQDSTVHRSTHPLRAGYGLVEARADRRSTSSFAVVRHLRPDVVLAGLPGGLEVAEGAAVTGIERVEWKPGCEAAGSRPLVRFGPAAGGALPAEAPPVLGFLHVARLLELARYDLGQSAALPGAGAARSFRVSAGAAVSSGEGVGLLVSPGDLRLEGDASFRGVAVLPGTLRLAGSARFEGVALAGSVRIDGNEAAIVGCPASATDALALPELRGPHPVPGGAYLGRF